ncbi:TRAP transporter small permease subunit [Cyanobacterium sp. Dongsha4]|uniref:TRAP transporter small permease subunit n=1 Tax=Cyanobacterium sp. DS4 TaxID=2878255 RepID=UPI002E819CC9|nr:TRAP transporter small permease subunit [Cyanobacterium sp. Dongsha4]WVL00843.1 TRAP transporter small permease subunit [Cyanobacterium sp. Dongsha4]
MGIALKISKIIDNISEWCGKISYGLVLVMIALGVWNVLGRYIGKILGENLSSNSFIELQWYVFDIVFFLGAAYALKVDSHVRVDLFYKDFSPKLKALVNILGVVLFVFPFCGVVIYFSWQYVANSWQIWEISADEGGLPRYPIKTMILVSPFLLILQGISEIIKNLDIFLNNSSVKVNES